MIIKNHNFVKILGIDYGLRYLGLAIADEQLKIAHPYQILENKGQDCILAELRKIVAKEKIKKIIVGRPIGLSSQPTEQTKITDQFIEFLKDNLNVPVEIFDERLTSKLANIQYPAASSQGNHAAAAAIILRDYLEKREGLPIEFSSPSDAP